MKGFKVFNPDWTCRGFQFEVGKTFTEDVTPACCDRGFHFCIKVSDCFNYYSFDYNNKVAEVEALGDIDTNDNDNKYCTNKIKIVRELTWQEVLDLVNQGKGNSGHHNSGNWNSGHYNSGHYNSGDWNSGHWNSGNYNSGNHNSGHHNSSYCNSGNHNSGHHNSSYYNSGNHNSGNYNSGYWNSGNHNSGYWNSGDWNSGDYNSGDYNSGHYNSGNYNSGNWNSGNYNTGCFNTKEQKIMMFDKMSEWTFLKWHTSKAYRILTQMPTSHLKWINTEDMTEEEKKNNSDYITTGGYLKYIEISNNDKQTWWNNLCEEDKETIKNLPNFDSKIFKEITGIDVEANVEG